MTYAGAAKIAMHQFKLADAVTTPQFLQKYAGAAKVATHQFKLANTVTTPQSLQKLTTMLYHDVGNESCSI